MQDGPQQSILCSIALDERLLDPGEREALRIPPLVMYFLSSLAR